MDEREESIAFLLRMIHNKTKDVVAKSFPKTERAPQSHLQAGILGFLYSNRECPIYQKDIEREFHISGATATNTLQAMEKNLLIVRKSQDRDARLKRISMTYETELEHAKVVKHMKSMDEKLVTGLSSSEIDTLRRLLGVISGNLEQMKVELEDDKKQEMEQRSDRL